MIKKAKIFIEKLKGLGTKISQNFYWVGIKKVYWTNPVLLAYSSGYLDEVEPILTKHPADWELKIKTTKERIEVLVEQFFREAITEPGLQAKLIESLQTGVEFTSDQIEVSFNDMGSKCDSACGTCSIAYKEGDKIISPEVYNERIHKLFIKGLELRQIANNAASEDEKMKLIEEAARLFSKAEFYCKNVDSIITIKKVVVEEENGEEITCDFYALNALVHELGHSVSSRWGVKGYEKDPIIGEIESVFIENIFNDYVLKNAKKVCKILNCGLKEEDLKDEVIITQYKNLEAYLSREKVFRTKGFKYAMLNRSQKKYARCPSKYYDKRRSSQYLVGEICARLLYEKYKTDPKGAVEMFATFLAHNSRLNLNEAVILLTDGACSNFREAKKAHDEIYKKQAEHVFDEKSEKV